MILLALDTSEKSQGLALMEDGVLLAESPPSQPSSHAEELLIRLKDLLDSVSLSFDQVEVMAVTVGPGSFTGLRIALATVKGLAMKRDIPVIPIGTLQALAAPYLADYPWVASCLDARMGQVYAAVFARVRPEDPIQELEPPQAFELNDFSKIISQLPRGGLVVGSGLTAGLHLANEIKKDPGAAVRASWVARLAHERNLGNQRKGREIRPAYLRLSTAETRLLEKSGLSAKKPKRSML